MFVLAGGSGTRLWPISRKAFPKQFLTFGDPFSLLQKTLMRFHPAFPTHNLFILTNHEHYHLVKEQATKIHPDLAEQVLTEPAQKNTAGAILLAAKYLTDVLACPQDEVFAVCSSDHILSPDSALLEALAQAEAVAKEGKHVLMGIAPHKPETAYGYIQTAPSSGAATREVIQFVEKPSRALAEQYILQGDFLWNSGIFTFQISTLLEELALHSPVFQPFVDLPFDALLKEYGRLPNISIDYALVEKSTRLAVMPLSISWSDVGSWDSVYDTLQKDAQNNATSGNVTTVDTNHCLILGDKRLIATIGLEDLLIIETEDALFIGKRGQSQRIKQLVGELTTKGAPQTETHRHSLRPWGSFTILEEGERYKIKRIVVHPAHKLSLQLHYHRSEHWVVIKGTAKVTLGDKEILLHENESTWIAKSTVHRLENPGKIPLEVIEIQVGEYLEEDDIIRLEDIYGR